MTCSPRRPQAAPRPHSAPFSYNVHTPTPYRRKAPLQPLGRCSLLLPRSTPRAPHTTGARMGGPSAFPSARRVCPSHATGTRFRRAVHAPGRLFTTSYGCCTCATGAGRVPSYTGERQLHRRTSVCPAYSDAGAQVAGCRVPPVPNSGTGARSPARRALVGSLVGVVGYRPVSAFRTPYGQTAQRGPVPVSTPPPAFVACQANTSTQTHRNPHRRHQGNVPTPPVWIPALFRFV